MVCSNFLIKQRTIPFWKPLLLTLTLKVGTYKWHVTHHLMMMHVSMKSHEILKEKGIFDFGLY